MGPDNDKLLRQMLPQVGMVVCAWGTDGVYQGRVEQVLRMRDVRGQALVVTRDGYTGHPVRLAKTLRPTVRKPK